MSKKRTISIDMDLVAELKIFAAKKRRTMSEVAEEAIRLLMEKEKEKKDG